MSNLPLAVFATIDDIQYIVEGDTVENDGLRWLLDNLPVEGDEELGVEAVRVALVAAPDGTLFNVLLNDEPVGYYALKAYCSCIPSLKLPEVLAIGDYGDLDLEGLREDTDNRIYTSPLFGELTDVGA
jgi:hypothetical protein